jgi:hypothetical protein
LGTIFYVLTGFWAVAMIAVFIAAIRLSYRIEARSPELVNRTGLPQRAKMLHTVSNWKVATDEETQRMRRRMNRLLLLNLAGFVVLWGGLHLAGAN